MITTTILPPPIKQFFDPMLLDPLQGIKLTVENKIISLAKKKIRPQDRGKKREFERLLKQFYETYERKKIEETQYKEKIKAASKRPDFATASKTETFRKFQIETASH